MNTFYSIIYATIRPDISEKISIGLIFVSDERVYYKSSKNKVNLLKHLLPAGPLKSIKEGLTNINTKFGKHQTIANTPNKLSLGEKVNHKEFSLSYLDYLSNYNNSLLTFSKPALIDIELSEQTFKTFFKKFVDDFSLEDAIPEKKKFEVFRKDYFQRVSKQFNIEQKLTSKEIPNLILPVRFDLVGKNERQVVAEFVNTESLVHTITNQVNNFFAYKEAMPDSKRFLVTSEPNKIQFPEQHNVWSNLRGQNKLADYVDQKEAGIIEEYAKKHGVTPLFV